MICLCGQSEAQKVLVNESETEYFPMCMACLDALVPFLTDDTKGMLYRNLCTVEEALEMQRTRASEYPTL